MTRSKYFERAAWQAKAFWKDTSGLMLPYVTAMLVVIIGVGLLAVDGARSMSLQTQMQAGADALALAGAAELDGQPGAISRAKNAIKTLFSNGLSGMGNTNSITPPTDADIAFYESLPAAKSLPSTNPQTAVDANAHFVSVTITSSESVQTIFPVSFLLPSFANSFTGAAQAVAGYGAVAVCGVPPVFICNPWEGSGLTLSQALSTQSYTQREMKVLNDGTFGPGHFGFLVPPDNNNGASNLGNWISTNNPKACYSSATVDVNTGAKQDALNGFNVRMDIGADANNSPDTNVRKGFPVAANGKCSNNSPSPDPLDAHNGIPVPNQQAMSLPEDTAFNNQIGDGHWNCAGYWSFNHKTAPAPTVRADGTSGVCGTSTTTTLSRYDVYTYENSQNLVTDWSRGTATNNYAPGPSNEDGETGTPYCAGVSNAVSGRRKIYMAVIDCIANSGALNAGGQTANNVPVAGYAKFFMTESVPTTGAASARNLVGELFGLVTQADNVVRLNVQLYR